MAYIAPIKKEDKRAGIIGAVIFLLLLLFFMLFTSMKQADPPFPTERVVLEMDFSDAGGGSSGGSEQVSEETSKSAKEQNETTNTTSEEDVATQEEESPVSADSHQESSSSNGNGNSSEQEAAYDFGNAFGGGNGDEGGNGDGGNGGGTGGGDGLGNGPGKGDGSSRVIQNVPNLNNLTSTPAKVAVKIKINNKGKVYWSEALLSNAYTNTSDKTIIRLAEKKALEFKYEPTSASTKYDEKIIKLDFQVK